MLNSTIIEKATYVGGFLKLIGFLLAYPSQQVIFILDKLHAYQLIYHHLIGRQVDMPHDASIQVAGRNAPEVVNGLLLSLC